MLLQMDKKSTKLIEATDISFTRDQKTILDHVSISIDPNDFITIIGPNGAGKTTLLKILLGIESADTGSIHRKEDVSIGYVPQNFHPDPTLPINVKSFLMLAMDISMDDLLQSAYLTGCQHLLEKQLSYLSGGELQKILITRALLKNPDILCLDEPGKSLDVKGQIALYKLIETIHKEKQCAILMVSHDLHLVMAKTKNVYCLYHHICCSGSADTVMKDPSFAHIFGDEFADMMSIYQHHHNHSHED